MAPGAGWGGRNFVNPGYFSPAWYRVFKAFDSNRDRHNWDSVIDQVRSLPPSTPPPGLVLLLLLLLLCVGRAIL